MSKKTDFSRFATECDRTAEDCEFSGLRDMLSRMADVWRQLEAEEERRGEVVPERPDPAER